MSQESFLKGKSCQIDVSLLQKITCFQKDEAKIELDSQSTSNHVDMAASGDLEKPGLTEGALAHVKVGAQYYQS